MLNLDTHIVVHALAGTLKPQEQHILERQAWGVSAIVFWELAKLVKLGRISLNLDDPNMARALDSLHVWPISLRIAQVSTNLDFRSDPADELIAATSVVHGIPLVTRDQKIRQSKIVPFIE